MDSIIENNANTLNNVGNNLIKNIKSGLNNLLISI